MTSVVDIDILRKIPHRDILSECSRLVKIPNEHRKGKERTIQFLKENITPDVWERLLTLHERRTRSQTTSQTVPPVKLPAKKRKRDVREDEVTALEPAAVRQRIEDFLQLPTGEDIARCYRAFYERTSNVMLEKATCASCSRLYFKHEDVGINKRYNIQDIPNRHRLKPFKPHPAHELVDGMLLDNSAINVTQDGTRNVYLCVECISDLKKASKTVHRPPRFSLANGMWVGDMPDALQNLTVPEQLLVSTVFTRAYVFKLYPKSGRRGDPGTLQSGIRGNVCSYPLNVEAISEMIDGRVLPQQAELLASIVSVTFIGTNTLPRDWKKHLFKVRRNRVRDALLFLKANNRHYRDIVIDLSRVQALPEDDIPDEVEAVMKEVDDISVLDKENDNYVNSLRDIADKASLPFEGDDNGPTVIPLELAGLIDVESNDATYSNILKWGLANLSSHRNEMGYAVRPGSTFVNMWNGQPEDENFYERAFPCLFPYGEGGIHRARPSKMEMPTHVRYLLKKADTRFRRHETFAFVAFNSIVRQQIFTSADVQMKHSDFLRDGPAIANITEDMLKDAMREEEAGLPITNAYVRKLQKHVTATGGRVIGSDQSRYKWKSQIWSTCLVHGPPSLWITVNPSDLHDPIAQIFCGEDIDLDKFSDICGPDKRTRAHNIARDPYAASEFFHYITKAVLECLIGVEVNGSGHCVKISMGILGKATAYFAVVESQGRGTLHLHLLVWLEGSPTPEKMQEFLQTADFRARVKEYIQHAFRAHVPGDDASSYEEVDAEKDVAYSRPLNPNTPDLEEALKEFENKIARAEQYHVCAPKRCLVLDGKGGTRCKRGAPFELANDDWVDEKGRWGLKRSNPHFNGWIPWISRTMRCNNDGKLLTNGDDSKNITFYICGYITKSQGGPYNASAVMAEGYSKHTTYPRPDYARDMQRNNRLFVYRILTALNKEREYSGPMVMSYLSGKGDVMRSHTYSPIYWASFVGTLVRQWPELRLNDLRNPMPNGRVDDVVVPEENPNQSTESDDTVVETIRVSFNTEGKLYAKSQVTDYSMRSSALETWNVLQVFMNSYEEDIPPGQRNSEERGRNTAIRVGRQRNSRCFYTSEHPRHSTKWRVIRSDGHRNLPNVIGKWLPRNDDPTTREFYCASILLLLKPWRTLEDLKSANQTWDEAFAEFLEGNLTEENERVMTSFQYFHECKLAADHDKSERYKGDPSNKNARQDNHYDEMEEDDDYIRDIQVRFTEEGLQQLLAMRTKPKEDIHGELAIEIGRLHGALPDDGEEWQTHGSEAAQPCGQTGNARLQEWLKIIESMDEEPNDGDERADAIERMPASRDGDVRRLEEMEVFEGDVEMRDIAETMEGGEESLKPIDVECLNKEQRRVFDIVMWHVREVEANRDPPPLRLLMLGEGGTGKSKVIQCLTAAFSQQQLPHWLAKAAYTGIAASMIDGVTTHRVGGAAVGNGAKGRSHPTGKTLERLEHFWRTKRYLIIDEISMISRAFLSTLSTNISLAKRQCPDYRESASFGGVNVIFAGDFHQFPPVAVGQGGPLYNPIREGLDGIDSQTGRKIYEEFEDVCILKKQMRNKDPEWARLLSRLREGSLPDSDIGILKALVLGNKDCPATDFSCAPWSDACLVTPRHGVRRKWNAAALRKWCKESGNVLYSCQAEDTYKGGPLTIQDRYGVACRKSSDKASARTELPDNLELAIGMKVMVTVNVNTELDIANGARGVIQDIILHPDEVIPDTDSCEVKLRHMPICVLVKMQKTRIPQLPGLEPGVIPLAPRTQNLQIKVLTAGGKTTPRIINRRQFPITAAYAFTDYRSQGQTLPHVILDLATPPTSTLTLFNLYVALSRSTGRENVRLLREFDPRLFKAKHDIRLLEEDDRLRRLDQKTTEHWAALKEAMEVDLGTEG